MTGLPVMVGITERVNVRSTRGLKRVLARRSRPKPPAMGKGGRVDGRMYSGVFLPRATRPEQERKGLRARPPIAKEGRADQRQERKNGPVCGVSVESVRARERTGGRVVRRKGGSVGVHCGVLESSRLASLLLVGPRS